MAANAANPFLLLANGGGSPEPTASKAKKKKNKKSSSGVQPADVVVVEVQSQAAPVEEEEPDFTFQTVKNRANKTKLIPFAKGAANGTGAAQADKELLKNAGAATAGARSELIKEWVAKVRRDPRDLVAVQPSDAQPSPYILPCF